MNLQVAFQNLADTADGKHEPTIRGRVLRVLSFSALMMILFTCFALYVCGGFIFHFNIG